MARYHFHITVYFSTPFDTCCSLLEPVSNHQHRDFLVSLIVARRFALLLMNFLWCHCQLSARLHLVVDHSTVLLAVLLSTTIRLSHESTRVTPLGQSVACALLMPHFRLDSMGPGQVGTKIVSGTDGET